MRCGAVPGRERVAGHHQRDDVGQPRAVANGALAELQERLVRLWGAPPARHLEEHRHLRRAVERSRRPATVSGCARLPSGRSSSPPTRPRSGSTRPAPTTTPADEPRYLLAAESIVSDWRRRPHRRVRARAPTRRFHHGVAAAAGPGRARAPARAAGRRLRGADRARLRDRRRRPAVEIFLAAIAALAFVLGARLARRIVPEPWASGGGAGRRALPARAGARDRRLPGAGGRRDARRRGAVRAARARAARPGQRGGGRGAARAAAVARPEVPAPGGAGGGRAGALDGAARAPHGGARGGRDHGRLARRLRDDQRPPLRRARCRRRWRPRASRRPARTRSATTSGARAAAGGAVDRPRRRAAALGAGAAARASSRPGCCGARAAASTSRAWSAEHADAEAAAGLSLLVCGAVLLVAAFAAPTLSGDWFPARHLVAAFPVAVGLVAWGLRHAPRTGAVLAALTLLCSAWLVIAFAFGGRRRLGAPGRGRALRAAGRSCCRASGSSRRTAAAVGGGSSRAARVWRQCRPWCRHTN